MTRKPKILLAVTLSEWGGAQHIVYFLAKHLRDDYDITVACAPGGELIAKLKQENIRVVEIPSLRRNPHPWHDLKALWQLYRLMKRERFEIVHTHSTKAGLLGRLAAKWAGAPAVIFTAHGWAFTEGRRRWPHRFLVFVERFAARFSEKIICVSEHGRQLALQCNIARPEQLTVIYNGFQAFEQANGATVRQELGLGASQVITFVARLAPPKDPLTLLEALRLLPDCKLICVGDGPLRSEAERFAAQNNLTDRVFFTGARMDVPEILAASDICVLASRREGLPLVIIEAMLAGLPVVATCVGGVPELVEEGVTGLLVPPGDPAQLAEALQKLLKDKSLRREMGYAGRERALKHFTLDRMITQYRALYETLTSSHRKKPR